MKNFAKFWDRIAPSYSRRPVADEAAYQHKLEKTREYLTPEMSVFEFGCGTGTTGIHHAPYVKSVRAIDVSKNMIDIARGKAAAKNIGNVEFEVAGIEESSLRDNEYDVVMAHSILHLLTDVEPVLAKIHRTLKPGGVFVSSTCVRVTRSWQRSYARRFRWSRRPDGCRTSTRSRPSSWWLTSKARAFASITNGARARIPRCFSSRRRSRQAARGLRTR